MLARASAKLILWIIIPDGVTFKMFRIFCFLLFSSQLAATEVENEINKVFQGLQLSKKDRLISDQTNQIFNFPLFLK